MGGGHGSAIETFSVAGSASTEKMMLREPGPKFTVTAQFSFPPREKPNEAPSIALLPHPGVQRVKGRVCFETSTSMASLSPSQAAEGTAMFSHQGRGTHGLGLALLCLENLAAPTYSYSLGIQGPGCSREKVLQWKGRGKRRGRERGKVGQSQNDCLQPLLLQLSINLQPRRATVWDNRWTPET